ncbi:MAG: hypothetical protein GXY76_11860, partial [Chloroflexi bacterium]|nr:hypothetical protein [Chloroflexota bacterium]
MTGIGASRASELREDFDKVLRVLERYDTVDKDLAVPTREYIRRQRLVQQELARRDLQ